MAPDDDSKPRCRESRLCNDKYQQGCLYRRNKRRRPRVCNSEDPPNAARLGICHDAASDLNYMEVRISSQNWESSLFESWLLQIVLSELLEIPTTIETGTRDARLNFYDVEGSVDDIHKKGVVSYDWDALERASDRIDCRKTQHDGDYQSCAHVIPEVWNGNFDMARELAQRGKVDLPSSLGMLGQQAWYVPTFTGERDATVLSYLGLQGSANRRKLASMFLRPTTWKDYCEFVSKDGCQTDDGVASRPPRNESEYDRMFVAEGVYTGHFRKTDKNDCKEHPKTCTGHIADYQCGWTSFMQAQTRWLNISLESDGSGPNGVYTYRQMTEMWSAAFYHKENLMTVWWQPNPIYQLVEGSENALQKVSLPNPTQTCVSARVHPADRCSSDRSQVVGSPDGACADDAHHLQKIISLGLFAAANDPRVPDALRTPAYDVVKSFSLSELQLSEIFALWQQRDAMTPQDAVCTWAAENLDTLLGFLPETHPRVLQEGNRGDPLQYAALGFAAFSTLFVLWAGFMVHRKRNRRIVMFAQAKFLWLLLSGLLAISVAAVLTATIPTDYSCVAIMWLLNVGYALALVPVAVKVAATNFLVSARRRRTRVTMKRQSLFYIFVVVMALVVVYVILWTVLDRPHRTKEYELTDEISEEDGGRHVVLVNYYCRSESDVWNYVFVGWNCFMLFCASVLAFQMSKMRRGFYESQMLAIMVYSDAVFVILLVVTFGLTQEVPATTLMHARSLVYSATSATTILTYFVPKFYAPDDASTLRSSAFLSPMFRWMVSRSLHVANSSQVGVRGSVLSGDAGSQSSSSSDESTIVAGTRPRAKSKENDSSKSSSNKSVASLVHFPSKAAAAAAPRRRRRPTPAGSMRCERCGRADFEPYKDHEEEGTESIDFDVVDEADAAGGPEAVAD